MSEELRNICLNFLQKEIRKKMDKEGVITEEKQGKKKEDNVKWTRNKARVSRDALQEAQRSWYDNPKDRKYIWNFPDKIW